MSASFAPYPLGVPSSDESRALERTPPAYAWDWFSRQRLLWRAARQRLAAGSHDSASKYRDAETRSEVLALLREDYPRDDTVREAVNDAVARYVFLGRTEVNFSALGVRTPPRGMRWWWTTLTGEELEAPTAPVPPRRVQLSLDDVHEGIGG